MISHLFAHELARLEHEYRTERAMPRRRPSAASTDRRRVRSRSLRRRGRAGDATAPADTDR